MATEPFDPGRHMSRLNGKDYLEVKWRLVWLRDRHPNASIVTKLLSDVDNRATFVCDIAIPDGGNATGHGSETAGDFRDYLEKAETKSIGRALAALGFGTQFCDDHNFGAEQGRVVDTPVARNTARREHPPAETTRTTQPTAERATGQGNAPQQAARPMAGPGPSSEAQHRMLRGLAKETNPDRPNMSDDRWLHGQVYARFRIAHLADLSKQHASSLIDWFQKGDFIDCQWAPENGRVDPVEAMQAGLAQMPEEPAHLRAAPWD